jgi:hypothetical protein
VHAPEQLCDAQTIKVKSSGDCGLDMYTETYIICMSPMKLTVAVMQNEIQSLFNMKI